MKKTIIIAATVAAFAVSCQKETIVEKQSRSISVTAEAMPLTKVGFVDGISAVWSEGETASLISTNGYQKAATATLSASQILNNGAKASFTFENVTDGIYRIASPEPKEVSSQGVTFNIPAAQTQKELGISGSRACLVGGVKGELDGDLEDLVVSAGTVKYDAYFKLAGAVLQFNIYDSTTPSRGELIKSVTVSATDAKLSGDFTVNYAGEYVSASETGNSVVTVNVETREIVVADKANAKAVYAVIVPATIAANESGSVTYTVETYGGSVYEFTSKSAKAWNSGVITPVNIDLAKATKITKYQIAAPVFVSTHPQSQTEGTAMTETESGVYTIKHVWVSGEKYEINFKFGDSGKYYNAYNGRTNAYVSSEDPEFDVVVSDQPVPLKIQQWNGKDYTEKYCTFILNTNTMKLKVLQDRGERFWLAGDPLSWTPKTFEMDVNPSNGIASWSGYLKTGNLRIYGENTSEDGLNGELYYPDSSKGDNGVSLNADGNKMWKIADAGYYSLEFNYKSSPMTFTVTKKESLDLKVNGEALKYIGNNEYSITTEFTKGVDFVLSGCKNLEYVKMDPDFLKDGKFNAKTGSYTFILHLGSHNASWTSNGQTPTNSWTLFKGINNGGTYSTMIIAGQGVANLTINNCVGWTCESSDQPFMAEIDDKVYQFTGRYREQWWHLEPYDRWTNSLKFKYSGNVWYGGGIEKGVKVVDNTGKITQNDSGDLTWKDSSKKWDDWGTYRMTVNMNNPQTVTFEKL